MTSALPTGQATSGQARGEQVSTKVTKLTAINVDALREMLTDQEQREQVTLVGRSATFAMDPTAALALVDELRRRAAPVAGTRAHPYASLAAVRRKVVTAVEQATPPAR